MFATETTENPWTLTILLVEDDPRQAAAVRERLASEGRGRFELEAVPRLEHAAAALRRRPYDVLLMDLALPQEPAVETLLRARMLAHRIPIVIMTGCPDEALGLRAMEAGVQEYLVTETGVPEGLGRALRHAALRFRIVAELRRSCQAAAPWTCWDPATGLTGGASFLRKLREALDFAARFREQPALLLVEPEDCAGVQERLGPVLGGRLLQELGRRLSWCVRGSDRLGRLGEERFAVLLSNVASAAAIRTVAERIRATVTAPFETRGGSVRLSASLGGAWYPQDGETARDLLGAAEAALAEARLLGANRCRFFQGYDLPPWPEDLDTTLSLLPAASAA